MRKVFCNGCERSMDQEAIAEAAEFLKSQAELASQIGRNLFMETGGWLDNEVWCSACQPLVPQYWEEAISIAGEMHRTAVGRINNHRKSFFDQKKIKAVQ